MTLIPTLEVGVWNAWIFALAFFFFHVASGLFVAPIMRGDLKAYYKKATTSVPLDKTEKRISNLSILLMMLVLPAYSVFLPLQLGTAWFYTGLAIFSLGLIVFEIATVNWATTPVDEPVTRGVYRFSRHPIYLAVFLQFIGVGVASASWVFLLVVLALVVTDFLLPIQERAEESFCLEKYGDVYREYMNKTPRWIGIPRSEVK